jgi:hypothetical protein
MTKTRMPRKVLHRIMERGAAGEKRVVLTYRDGVPSRVIGYEAYQRMQGVPGKHKPWEKRTAKKSKIDPLGGIDAGVRGPINRDSMYE